MDPGILYKCILIRNDNDLGGHSVTEFLWYFIYIQKQ